MARATAQGRPSVSYNMGRRRGTLLGVGDLCGYNAKQACFECGRIISIKISARDTFTFSAVGFSGTTGIVRAISAGFYGIGKLGSFSKPRRRHDFARYSVPQFGRLHTNRTPPIRSRKAMTQMLPLCIPPRLLCRFRAKRQYAHRNVCLTIRCGVPDPMTLYHR